MTADVRYWRWALARHVAFSDQPLVRGEGVRGLLDLEENGGADEMTWLAVPDDRYQPSCENTNEFWKDGGVFSPRAPKPAARVPLSSRAPIEAPIARTPMPESKQNSKLPKSPLAKRAEKKMRDSIAASFSFRLDRGELRNERVSPEGVVDFREFCKDEQTQDREEENPFCWLLETPECPEGFKQINGLMMFKNCLGERDCCLSARNPRTPPKSVVA